MDLNVMASQLADKLTSLDDQLKRAGDTSVGYRESARQNIVATAPADDDFADRVVAKLQSMPIEQAIALWFAAQERVDSKFADEFDPIFKAEVDRVKSTTPATKVSEEEISRLREEYNAEVKKWQSLVEVAKAFGQEEALASFGTFKPKRGGVGKRGKRLARKYRWTVDDSGTVHNNLSNVALAAKADGAAEIREALRNSLGLASDDDLGDADKMPPVIEFTFSKNNATRIIRGVEVDDDDDDDNGDDSDVEDSSE